MSDVKPTTPRRIPTLKEAQTFAYAKRYADARALYLWLLARTPSDTEAKAALARVDAWDGCWGLAEEEFRAALFAHREDADVRVGLIDLYMWQKRWDDARRQIDQGLALDPDSPALLLRRARLLHFTFDDSEALDVLHDVKRRMPADAEIQDLAAQIFLGQASMGIRFDAYPSGYPGITTMDAQLMQRWRRFEFGLSSHLVDWAGGSLSQPIVDSERSVRVAYHPAAGFTTALELGFGNPGVVLPVGEVAAEVVFPLYGRFAGVVDYDYWAFAGNESVHIFNPTLAYEATDELEVAAHAWIVHVGGGPANLGAWAETWGAHAGWKALPGLRLTLYYTYGAQLDRDPTFTQLLTLRSHIVTAAADRLLTRDLGVRALLAFEVREQDRSPTIPIASVGAAFYVLW